MTGSSESNLSTLLNPAHCGDRFITDFDIYLFSEGTHDHLYHKLGAQLTTIDGEEGVHFAVWAPNATQVSVIGDFNQWTPHRHSLCAQHQSGLWTGFIPHLKGGELYKYHIENRNVGFRSEKTDPLGFASEHRPRTASKVWPVQQYKWHDQDWIAARPQRQAMNQPISVYEVHLGSWMRVPEEENRWLTYRELADKLTAYVVEMGYTHVELLPIAEHPLDASWGYQTVGYFSPTSRFGSPDDFKFLVDTLHQHNIGVILDWVPAHFPKDGHGLGVFDGTHLYEHADARQGEHKDWGTYIFNYGRNEVRNFLISNAMFWLEVYHLDGLRVDAVASMLYLDYSREEGEWLPNAFGGRENLEAIEFIKQLNEKVHGRFPGALMMAEESTDWPQVSRPTYLGGLGFGYKWDMGWMHDTLCYMSEDPVHRKYHHNQLTFRGLYANTENFMLPLSHDEVVHGKQSLVNKMPGDVWQKRANLRLLLGYQYTLTGKKLLFMGGDIGQWDEWHFDGSIDWHLLQYPEHRGIQNWVRDLNRLYQNEPAMHQLDCDPHGFEWLDCNDHEQSVLSYIRKAANPRDQLVIVMNLTPVPRYQYHLGVDRPGFWHEALNSDAELYGGSGLGNCGGVHSEGAGSHGRQYRLSLTLPPLGMLVLKPGSD